MNNQPFDKIKSRDTFDNKLIILMPGIVEGHKFPVISADTGSSNNRPSKITADIWNGDFGSAWIRFGLNIKAIRLIMVDGIFHFSERSTMDFCHTFKKDFLKGIFKEVIIKMLNMTPGEQLPAPPSDIRAWTGGFHLRPKVWRTQIQHGVKFSDLFIFWNMRRTQSWTE